VKHRVVESVTLSGRDAELLLREPRIALAAGKLAVCVDDWKRVAQRGSAAPSEGVVEPWQNASRVEARRAPSARAPPLGRGGPVAVRPENKE
jgi:hypothetical protein